MKGYFITLLLLIGCQFSYAQSLYQITGRIKNANGEALESATVFLNGSSQQTLTNKNGEFKFLKLSSGTYQLVISMVGYEPLKESFDIQAGSLAKTYTLQERRITLNEVIIGNKSRRNKHFKTFFDNFIGTSENAQSCKILNPEIIEYTTNGTVLEASSPDFLIIENNDLGYTIKYLISYFKFDSKSNVTNYDGECVFEIMKGTPNKESNWNANRKFAYRGSFMHYLRSVYAGNSDTEGFSTHHMDPLSDPPKIEQALVDMSRYVLRMDNNFAELKFKKQLHVSYSNRPARPPVSKRGVSKLAKPTELVVDNTVSYFKLHLDRTIIDSKGNYENYRSFWIDGRWGRMRIGDRLPFEYVPEQ
ncbi:MAG: carboxypeptidase-like regulatory domain-containing protein [Bacteroidota bacterium]